MVSNHPRLLFDKRVAVILINAESQRTRDGSLIERVGEIFFLVTIARSIPSRVPRILRKGEKRLRALCNLLPLPRYYPCSLLRIRARKPQK